MPPPIAAIRNGSAIWRSPTNNIGDVLVAQGKLDEALKAYRDGLAIRERLAAADPGNTRWQRDLSVSYNKVGDVLMAQGKLDEALKAYRDSLAICERLAAADPSNTQWQRDLSVSYDKVGDVLVAQGKLDEALKAYRDGLAIRERLAAADRSNTDGSAICRCPTTGSATCWWRRASSTRRSRPTATASPSERLAAADRSNTQWQRDLQYSIGRIGGLAYSFLLARNFVESTGSCRSSHLSRAQSDMAIHESRPRSHVPRPRRRSACALSEIPGSAERRRRKSWEAGDFWRFRRVSESGAHASADGRDREAVRWDMN